MATPTTMTDLSVTAASNSPAGSESPTAGDDFLRAIQAILRTTNAKGADIASATTTDIGAATGEFVDVTGTTTITGLGTIAAGIVRTVRFTGALVLTHNATSLQLPTSANITTANGDVAQFRSLGSGNWKCVGYIPQAGYVRPGANSDITSLTGLTTPLSVAQGGTGAATLTLNNVLLGNGTSAPQAVAPGTSGNVLTSNGTTWASSAPAAAANASETVKGIVELATTAEAVTGTDTVRAVTPAGVKAATNALSLSAITLGTAIATTSGTTHNFGSLPATIKQITITLSEVSFNAAVGSLGARLGTGGTLKTTGYVSFVGAVTSTANTTAGGTATAGFVLSAADGTTSNYSGTITFTLQDASTNTWCASGVVGIDTAPSRAILVAGYVSLAGTLDIVGIYGGTFDGGKVNIAYS